MSGPGVKFMQGSYDSENLRKIANRQGERVKETYLLPDGTIVYLKDQLPQMEVESLIYDLEKRIKEINDGCNKLC